MNNQTNSGISIGKGMSFAAWIIVLIFLSLFFNRMLEQQANPNQNPEGEISADGSRTVVLTRNRAGHYVANGKINGQVVEFLVDTGATDVAIPLAVAEDLGLTRQNPVIYRTANGSVQGWQTVISQLELGPVKLTNLRGGINPGMHSRQILLGMSALKQLNFSQQGNQLTLNQSL